MNRGSKVGIVGDGPCAAAIEAALEDVDAEGGRIDVHDVDTVDLPVVVGPVGSPTFEQVGGSADRWLAVEFGGVGGHALADVDAAVTSFGPDTGCFECLRLRVAANIDDGTADDTLISRSDARLIGALAGHHTVSLISGEAEPGTVLELPHAERRLLAVPGCECSPGRDRTLGRDDDEFTVEEVAARAEGAIDDRIGIVSSIGEAESFPAPYYLATLANTTTFSDVEAGPQAAGVAVDWNEAFVKAVGEALERYAAGVYREESFEFAAVSEIEDAISPGSFVTPDQDDGPERDVKPDPGETIAWVPGENLKTGGSVKLPAEFVHFPPPDERHKPAITTGLGLGSSTVGALLSGLYETVERDATMIAWYSTFEPLGLAVDDPAFEELSKRARSEGLSVRPLLVTQDVDVPVVSVAVHREDEWPRFAVGSGADLDPVAAARSALEEALQNWMELRGMGPEAATEESTAIGRYADFPPAVRSFVSVEGEIAAEDLAEDDVPTGTNELDTVVDRVAESGLDAYAARVTTRDLDTLGFEAVRVLVPEAQPLFTGERYFGERARRVPGDHGFKPRLDRGPHPYP